MKTIRLAHRHYQRVLWTMAIFLILNAVALTQRGMGGEPPAQLPTVQAAKVARFAAGKIIFVREGDGRNRSLLTAIDPENKRLEALIPDSAFGSGLFSESIAVSPDGAYVAYTSDSSDGIHGKVFIRSLADLKQPSRCLAENGGMALRWSPDGRKLLVQSRSDEESFVIESEIINVETKERHHLPLPKPANLMGGFMITDWSPDGKWLLATDWTFDEESAKEWESGKFKDEKRGPKLCRIHLQTLRIEPLAHLGRGIGGRISPNGKQILYCHMKKGRNDQELCVADVAGGKPVRVSQELNGEFSSYKFCWSRDGKRIAYVWNNRERLENNLGKPSEDFLSVVEADGQNNQIIHAEKAGLGASSIGGFLDWR
jgi:Tol biopolymer transport system component